MTFEEYRQLDAAALAQLVQKKELQAVEILEIAIQRAEEVNPAINAVIHPLYDLARQMAQAVDTNAPLAGVPFLLKDLALQLKGTPVSSGCRSYKIISKADSALVHRYRELGLLFMGKTNTPEFGLTPYTEPEAFGPSRNPWNTSRTTGGSSGGSAAAVAAGITPIATASDGGGSIRIPASCCGLFGLKPSRGRLSLGPQQGEMWSGAVVEGCISRTVRDTALFLDLSGATEVPGEPYLFPNSQKSLTTALSAPPAKLTIGFATTHPLGLPVDADCIAAVHDAAALLESLGHHVEETDLPIEREDLTKVFLMMVFGETDATLRQMAQDIGRKVTRKDVEITTWGLHLLGREYTAGDYAFARRRWNDISRRLGAFHQRFDILLTPTVAMSPFPIGALQPTPTERRLLNIIGALNLKGLLNSKVDELADKTFGFIPFTPLANMTGQPSMSVPLFWNNEGLPVGTMFTAAIGRDDLLISLAGQLEQARPWKDRWPAL